MLRKSERPAAGTGRGGRRKATHRGCESGFSGKILAHPGVFLQALPAAIRPRALAEFQAIRCSNPGTLFNLLTFWFRQTRYPAVRAALEDWFRAVIRGA